VGASGTGAHSGLKFLVEPDVPWGLMDLTKQTVVS
jgi:hypothetical protein